MLWNTVWYEENKAYFLSQGCQPSHFHLFFTAMFHESNWDQSLGWQVSHTQHISNTYTLCLPIGSSSPENLQPLCTSSALLSFVLFVLFLSYLKFIADFAKYLPAESTSYLQPAVGVYRSIESTQILLCKEQSNWLTRVWFFWRSLLCSCHFFSWILLDNASFHMFLSKTNQISKKQKVLLIILSEKNQLLIGYSNCTFQIIF